MYTIIWQEKVGDDYIDRWDRVEKESLVPYLQEITKDDYVCAGDIWIFPPTADDLATTADEWL